MAGEGRKIFNTNDILLASDVQDYLMDQTVMVFADATERSSEILVPSEGMVSYLESDNKIYKYDGANWVDIAPALALDDLTDVATSGVAQNKVLTYGTATSSWTPQYPPGFTASTAIVATNASWPVPTLGNPIVKITAVGGGGGGGGGAVNNGGLGPGGNGGSTTVSCSAGTVTAAGGQGANGGGGNTSYGGRAGTNGLSAGNHGSEGLWGGNAEQASGATGLGGKITVGYLDLTGISTLNVQIGSGGTGATFSVGGGAGGSGEVIIEYMAG